MRVKSGVHAPGDGTLHIRRKPLERRYVRLRVFTITEADGKVNAKLHREDDHFDIGRARRAAVPYLDRGFACQYAEVPQ